MIRFMAVLVPIVFLILGITGGKWLESFAFALSVAVGLMPEMLPMVITACLAKGSLAMGKRACSHKGPESSGKFRLCFCNMLG